MKLSELTEEHSNTLTGILLAAGAEGFWFEEPLLITEVHNYFVGNGPDLEIGSQLIEEIIDCYQGLLDLPGALITYEITREDYINLMKALGRQ